MQLSRAASATVMCCSLDRTVSQSLSGPLLQRTRCLLSKTVPPSNLSHVDEQCDGVAAQFVLARAVLTPPLVCSPDSSSTRSASGETSQATNNPLAVYRQFPASLLGKTSHCFATFADRIEHVRLIDGHNVMHK
jgi:hypothetical protein